MSLEHISKQSEIPREEVYAICKPWRNYLDINVIIEEQAVLCYNYLYNYLFFPQTDS